MNHDELRKLLGGYATGTLTADENRRLMTAAMEDQRIFDALADEEALRELLDDPAFRQELLADLRQPKPNLPETIRAWWQRPLPLTLAAGLATVVLAALVLVPMWRQDTTVEMAMSQETPQESLMESEDAAPLMRGLPETSAGNSTGTQPTDAEPPLPETPAGYGAGAQPKDTATPMRALPKASAEMRRDGQPEALAEVRTNVHPAAPAGYSIGARPAAPAEKAVAAPPPPLAARQKKEKNAEPERVAGAGGGGGGSALPPAPPAPLRSSPARQPDRDAPAEPKKQLMARRTEAAVAREREFIAGQDEADQNAPAAVAFSATGQSAVLEDSARLSRPLARVRLRVERRTAAGVWVSVPSGASVALEDTVRVEILAPADGQAYVLTRDAAGPWTMAAEARVPGGSPVYLPAGDGLPRPAQPVERTLAIVFSTSALPATAAVEAAADERAEVTRTVIRYE